MIYVFCVLFNKLLTSLCVLVDKMLPSLQHDVNKDDEHWVVYCEKAYAKKYKTYEGRYIL